MTDSIHELVRRQELFARRQCEPILSESGLAVSEAVWFGVGISTDRISSELPLDVMILLYCQEMLRRQLDWPIGLILIADTNALSSGINNFEVRRASARTRDRLERVIADLGFPVSVIFASDIRAPSQQLLESIDVENPYLAQQMAQTEVMRRTGAGLKLGWALSSSKHDETFFDTHYRSHFGDEASFVYSVGGRTLDPKRPRACPYLCKDPAERLLLAPTESVRGKLAAADKSAGRGAARLLAKLARAHKHLTGRSFSEPEDYAEHLVSVLQPTNVRVRPVSADALLSRDLPA